MSSTTAGVVPKKKVIVSPLAQIKELEQDPKLLKLCEQHLPPNYDFEIAKTVWRIRKTNNCQTVALQMPEGLLLFATKVATVLTELTGVETILMGDVTYGACCIDDFTASMLGAQLLVHYGHSCLVPTSVASRIETIYVFVTIKYNIEHAMESIGNLLKGWEKKKESGDDNDHPNSSDSRRRKHIKISTEVEPNISGQQLSTENTPNSTLNISLVSTIQFAYSLPILKEALEKETAASLESSSSHRKIQVTIPRSKPLSNGEILGCTAPTVQDDIIVYVGDGRFHLEAMMMANPSIEAYRYDPYNKTLTLELFDHEELHRVRGSELKTLQNAQRRLRIGIILGTLGRQGNPKPLDYVYEKLSKRHDCFIVLMSEVIPAKLALFTDVDVWVQFACPRLSIDWGTAFSVPILTPYEAIWGLETSVGASTCSHIGQGDCTKTTSEDSEQTSCCKTSSSSEYKGHPMDYYAYDSLGLHTPNFMLPAKPKIRVGK